MFNRDPYALLKPAMSISQSMGIFLLDGMHPSWSMYAMTMRIDKCWDLLNPTPTQKLIERELLFGTRDVCCIGTARAGKGVAAVKGMVLRSQMHKELGIGSGDYLLIAQSVGAIHRN